MIRRPRVVAIDGAAGTGKSTVARLLADALGVPHLDTGAMYRTLALMALDRGLDVDDCGAMEALAGDAPIELRLDARQRAEVLLAGAPVELRIRTPEVTAATTRLAVHPGVRERMVGLQRELASRHGGVLEGRDIGTRVLPDAPHKFFLVASPAIRVGRRLQELHAAGRTEVTEETLARELEDRDARDSGRAVAPLQPADDAIEIDTTNRSVADVVATLLAQIEQGD